jgi:hypothetical protein
MLKEKRLQVVVVFSVGGSRKEGRGNGSRVRHVQRRRERRRRQRRRRRRMVVLLLLVA